MSFFVEFIIFYRYPERNTSLSGNLVRSAIAVASRKDETEDYNMVTLEQVRRSLETEMKNENVSKSGDAGANAVVYYIQKSFSEKLQKIGR